MPKTYGRKRPAGQDQSANLRNQLIRHGTVARLRGRLMPGSATSFGWGSVDTLDFEFEVLTGRYSGRKFWEFFPVDVSPQQPRGRVDTTCRRLRAMIDSALGLDPRDMSKSARPKRILRSLTDFDRIEFAGRIAVEKVGSVGVNRLARVIVPGDPQWHRLMESCTADRLPMRRAVA